MTGVKVQLQHHPGHVSETICEDVVLPTLGVLIKPLTMKLKRVQLTGCRLSIVIEVRDRDNHQPREISFTTMMCADAATITPEDFAFFFAEAMAEFARHEARECSRYLRPDERHINDPHTFD